MNIQGSGGFNAMQLFMQARAGKNSPAPSFSVDVDIEIEVGVTTGTEPAPPKTVDDVKKEFYDYLNSLNVSPGLRNTALSVNVTEAAFEKMLRDPEYMQKMKDLCARDICDPGWIKSANMGIAPDYSRITIDADVPEEYLASSWSSPKGEKRPENADGGFWSRRKERSAAAREAQAKKREEDQAMLEFLQERAAERMHLTGASPFANGTGTAARFPYSCQSSAASFFASIAQA